MNDNKMELEELDLEQIMKEFGDSDGSIADGQEEMLAELGDTQDLLDVIDQIDSESRAETQPEEPAEAPAAEEPAAEKAAEEPENKLGDTKDLQDSLESLHDAATEKKLAEVSLEETQRIDVSFEETDADDMDDTVRLDDLSGVVGTPPALGHAVTDETTRIGSIWDEETEEDEDSVEIKIPAPIVFRPKQRLRDLKRDLIAGPRSATMNWQSRVSARCSWLCWSVWLWCCFLPVPVSCTAPVWCRKPASG